MSADVTQVRSSDERSIGELLSQVSTDVQRLLRAEVALAKAETREQIGRATDAGKYVGVAAATAVLAVLLLSFAAAWGLAEVMPAGVAFLIVGAVYAVIATVAAVRARERVRTIHPIPDETVETLKEDVQWAKARAN